MSVADDDDDEYAYSSDEDGYPIDDESNMDWKVSATPNAAPTKYSSKRTYFD